METEKEKHRSWLVAALAANPEKTQTDLAAAMGLHKSAISKIISGARGMKSYELIRASEFLEAPLPLAGFAEAASVFDHGPFATRPRMDAPIYAAEPDEGARWVLRRDLPAIDARPRAPAFEHAAQVFGFYAPDEAAAPRFKAGEIVWVDPVRPIKGGDDALFVEQTRGAQRAVLGEFRRSSASEIVCVQYADQKERRFSKTHWTALHVLARY
ncbi:MAG: helix-turn-helix domain-containing protein [Pseudomonadota bacterium]